MFFVAINVNCLLDMIHMICLKYQNEKDNFVMIKLLFQNISRSNLGIVLVKLVRIVRSVWIMPVWNDFESESGLEIKV